MDQSRIRDYYDERYSTESGEAFPPDPSRYREWFDSLERRDAPGRFLDYGCGVGYVCSRFVARGWQVTGVDISAAALEVARRREPDATFLETTPGNSLPLEPETFDVVTCLGVLEHIPDPAPVVADLRRVAKPGAQSVWVVPNARSPYFWFGHGTGQVEEHPRTLGEWRDLLTAGGWEIEGVRRDPGPIDRPVAAWKRVLQTMLNKLPLGLTYQFVIEARAAGS